MEMIIMIRLQWRQFQTAEQFLHFHPRQWSFGRLRFRIYQHAQPVSSHNIHYAPVRNDQI